MKSNKTRLSGRMILCIVLLVLQLVLVFCSVFWLSEYFSAIYYWALTAFTALAGLTIVNSRSNPDFKVAWLVMIALTPFAGLSLYALFGNKQIGRRQAKRIDGVQAHLIELLPQNRKLEALSPDAALQAHYLARYAYAPVWGNTAVTYFSLGEEKFAELLRQLEGAKKFIFIEYFIISPGKMWSGVLDILTRKAAEGLDVRVLYDDFGSAKKLPDQYYRTLRERGIRAYSYNKVTPVLDVRLNNRDHRKIVIIDGNVGFTGGVNLADEYINEIHPYGHWKDCAVMLQGAGVYNLTMMFLSLWDTVDSTEETADFRPDPTFAASLPENGFVVPYGDYPFDNEPVGRNVYLNLINRARKSIHICTPYLVPDNETVTALCNAAKSDIEVSIVTPFIPDKSYVFTVTRSFYDVLIESGVHIYEYTPGFIHSKSFVVDGEYATVGTANLDYRSFYFHLECGVWMYRTSCIADMEADFARTVAVSTPPGRKIVHPNFMVRLGRSIMRLVAPLM